MYITNENGKYVFTFYYDIQAAKVVHVSGVKCTEIIIPSRRALIALKGQIDKVLQDKVECD